MTEARVPMVVRVYADADGETHLAELTVPGPPQPIVADVVARVIRGVPATTLQITQRTERQPKYDLHPAPRRQLVVVLTGEFQVTTTSGDARRFGPGDCLFADDVAGKGHIHEDVGDDCLATLSVGVGDGWQWPDDHAVGEER